MGRCGCLGNGWRWGQSCSTWGAGARTTPHLSSPALQEVACSPSARISSGPHLQMEEVGKFMSARTERPAGLDILGPHGCYVTPSPLASPPFPSREIQGPGRRGSSEVKEQLHRC